MDNIAMGVTTPNINPQAFNQGVAAGQAAQINTVNIDQAKQQQYMQGLNTIAAGAAYAIDPQTRQVDPKKWQEVVDSVAKSGADVASFRDHPNLAPMLLQLSLTTQQQIANAQSQQQIDMAVQNFGLEAKRLEMDQQRLKAQVAQGGYDSPEKFALNATYYTVKGPDGKDQVQFGVLGDRGTFKPVPLPDGASPAVPVQQLNTGTDFVPRDKFGNIVAGAAPVPINNAQAAQDTAIGKGTGENIVAEPALKSKWQSAISGLDQKTKLVGDTIDTVINQVTSNPTFTTGTLGDWSKAVAGTPAYDVYQNLLTIQSNIGFDKLQQMRADSPTGGALGQVSDTEEKLLQAVQGALAQGQTKDQLIKNLKQVKQLQLQAVADQHSKFERDFKSTPAAGSPAAGAPSGDVVDWTTLDWGAP